MDSKGGIAMSDKEKLEEIKSRYKEDVYDCKLGRFDIQWLIKQAELAEELKEELHFTKCVSVSMESIERYTSNIKEENKRLCNVLNNIKKYANDCIDVKVEMNPYLVIDDIKVLESKE